MIRAPEGKKKVESYKGVSGVYAWPPEYLKKGA